MRIILLNSTAALLISACLSAQAQSPVINGVYHGASGLPAPLAPGEYASINGSNIGGPGSGLTCGVAGANPVPVPTVCGGVSVLVNGTAANVRSEAGNLITFIAPITLTGASATIQVTTQNGAQQSNVFTVNVAPTSPGIATTQINGVTYGNFSDANGSLITAANPAPPGSTVKALGTGFGVTNPLFTPGPVVPTSPPYNVVAAVNVTVGGQNAAVNSATLQPNALNGMNQVSFVVPAGLSTGSYPVVVSVGGVNSQTFQLSVGPAANGPVVSSVTDLSGGTKFCPGGQAIIAGGALGNSPTVTVGGKTAYNLVQPSTNGGSSMTIQIPVDAPLGSANLVVTLTTGPASTPFPITLSQYAPVLPRTGTQGNFAQAFHVPSGQSVNTSFPASPNEQIGFSAIGLGPTKPQVPTGVAPGNPSPATATLPTVSLGGKPASVVNSSAAPNQIASYVVVIKVPADAAAGSLPLTLSIGGATSNSVTIPVSTAPYITSVSNAASGIIQGLPNSGIAQGAIFTVFGALLGPDAISISPTPFQSTTLSGTSMSVTVAGTTVSPLLYYTSAGQVAALLPSNTPTGTGTITVTYNNQTGSPAAISVVQNNLGIFTVTSNGIGAGIVTYADYSVVSSAKAGNCGGPNTTCGAANPGDALTLWATGLGPVDGSDAAGAGLGVNMTNVPLQLWIGGVQASVTYQGRSGYIGEDQINFTIPNNVPTGCAVPLVIQINNQISNNVVIPIASGSRSCTPSNPALSTAALAQLASGGPTTYIQISLNHVANVPASSGFQDKAGISAARITVAPGLQPFIASYVDDSPLGTCLISNTLNGSDAPFATATALDLGAQLTVSGPNGNQSFPLGGPMGDAKATLSANGSYLTQGAYTVNNGSGGADIKAFSANITIPVLPAMTSPQPDTNNSFSVSRSSGFPVTWSGGTSSGQVLLTGQSATDNSNTNGAGFQCSVNPSAGTFTIPPYILLALPAGSMGGLNFQANAAPANFPAAGLDLGFVTTRRDSVANLTFK